ncbi:hypothetical protein LJR235_002322 [Pararhizobium sp. LjRoot235]|uniref:hypothetical protein n=1 Tax=Pararhizobium sp. LjRoot235 TaxID=3342291 RepID=UPI003ECDCC87
MTDELRTIALQWFKRFLFPDFTNKLTWLVALGGIALAGAPSEILVAGLNWVVAFVNQNQFTQPPLPTISTPSDPMGYWLVFGALTHNLLNKLVSYRLNALEHKRQQERREMDIRLFDALTTLLPSNSGALYLAKEHHFGNSFAIAALNPVTEFVQTWDKAEFEFVNKDIEVDKRNLMGLAGDFTSKVAQYTAPNGFGMQSAIPRGIDPDFGLPEHISQEIRELNEAASAFYTAHQSFIRAAREKL